MASPTQEAEPLGLRTTRVDLQRRLYEHGAGQLAEELRPGVARRPHSARGPKEAPADAEQGTVKIAEARRLLASITGRGNQTAREPRKQAPRRD